MSTGHEALVAAAWVEIPQFVSATALFQSAVADQLGVPVNDLHCLNLVSAGLAVTPTQLAERMGMTTGAVSKMLDRMEAQRLVRREHDPHDRRRITVHARPDRADELAALYQPMATYLTERIAGFTDDQLRLLTDFAHTGREVALREATRLREGGRSHSTRKRRPPDGPPS
ncbi:MarR family transcriptional regulator [Micromonospora sp. NPDC049101]|uniref:MarR family winged helix-turn-helix transcriptional regulator n=1 Tax=unclassified Micromonospora TaxID=2617518 RepID=UPI0033D37974